MGLASAPMSSIMTLTVTQADGVWTAPPVTSVAELVARLTAIEQAVPKTDGAGCFARMYRVVTEAVEQQLGALSFDDPAWMSQLDIVFGNLFLAALADWATDPSTTPRAWAALLERRADVRVTPLQFALAGMSAHINRDLPVALCNTSRALNTSVATDSHAADYARINAILATVEPSIRESFEDDVLRTLDEAAPGLQHVVATFDLVTARQVAWTNAQALWTLQHVSDATASDYLDALDRMVGFAGRGLLVPLRAAP